MRFFPAALFAWALLLTQALLASVAPSSGVTYAEGKSNATIANSVLAVVVDKTTGKLTSFRTAELELLTVGGAYWDCVGDVPSVGRWGTMTDFSVVTDPASNGGESAEVSCRFEYKGAPRTLPLNITIHYILRRDDAALHTFAVIEHGPEMPALVLAEGRMALKLSPQVFDVLCVDEKRQREMPTGEDWNRGIPLNLKEARRLTTGTHAGKVEHKYDYSAMTAQIPTWGWASTREQVGLWIINPSAEYLAGGPTRVDLTGHLDAGQSASPVLLNMWQSKHYGGRPIYLKEGEPWKKQIGPFAIYTNRGGSPQALWRDACQRAEKDREIWPFAWLGHTEIPGKDQRGSVKGHLLLHDPKEMAAGAWIGLAAPAYPVDAPFENPRTFTWEFDGKYYQHWVRADSEGRFLIDHVRPGRYSLHAFTDGVLGEFQRSDVIVQPGETLDLAALDWTPKRYGRQLWEIGVPNRSAEEFRNGDNYWQWGLYFRYAKEFPNDVDFVIGKSDWRRDWNYCQPPRVARIGQEVQSTTWKIRFDLPAALRGKATLRLAIAGSRAPRGVAVSVNDIPAGGTGPLPDTAVMHRDGIRGAWCERQISFDAAMLKPGLNVISLHVPARSWFEGVLYDYLRLEIADDSPPSPDPA